MKYIIITSALVFYSVFALAYPHPGGAHPQKQIDFVKERLRLKDKLFMAAYAQLLAKADTALLSEHRATPNLSIPGFYFNSVAHRKGSSSIQADSFHAYSCALAWQLSGKRKYAEKALYYINAWSHINKSYSDADGPLVLSYSGSAMVMAAELMRNYGHWHEKDQQQFVFWLKNVYRKAGNEIRGRQNNWGDWGRLASILADYYLDDEKDMAENVRLIKSDLFLKIADDGHLIEEVKREANGIWYTYFSLTPISSSFWVIYNATGENLFQLKNKNKSFKKALDYLLYFEQNPTEWTWFKQPRTGKTDYKNGRWPANLIEAMYGIYNDEKYFNFIEPIRPILYDKHHFSWAYPTLFPAKLHYR